MSRLPGPGDLVDRYQIERTVGLGGMGVVHLATDTRLHRPVALKLISSQLASDSEFRERFQREAAVLARLDSPHVVQIFDHGEHAGFPFIATQFVAGGDLVALLQERQRLSIGVAAAICAQVAQALHDAHGVGVVHRDVKAANVLVRDPGARDLHVYLCDFGIAQTEAAGMTRAGAVAGTWAYLAPERADGHPATPASDIYALGCLLWVCLTGAPPFSGTEAQMAMAHVNAPVPQVIADDETGVRLNEILRRTLAKAPGDRFADADQLQVALAALARRAEPTAYAAVPDVDPPGAVVDPAGQVTNVARATGATAPKTPRDQNRRTRRTTLVTVGGAVLLVALGGTAWWALHRDDPPARAADAPANGPAVTGDVDGDGFGDVMVSQERASSRTAQAMWTLSSTGKAFGPAQRGPGVEAFSHLLVDVDGDGRNDAVSVTMNFTDARFSVMVDPAHGDSWTWERPAASAAGLSGGVDFADATGDGRADLLFHGTTEDGRLGLYVARSIDGGFDDLEQWYAGQPEEDDGALDVYRSGDFDGDGDADLLVADRAIDAGSRLVEFTSTGSAYERSAAGYEVKGPGFELGLESMVSGDFDGDGADEIAAMGGRGGALRVFEFRGDRVSDVATWLRHSGLDLGTQYQSLVVSDVDGDDNADLVHLADPADGARAATVFRSTGHDFEASTTWGTLPCAPDCRDRFDLVATR